MQRRVLLATSCAAVLARCGTTGTAAVTLAQAQAYLTTGVAALEAAAEQYLAGPPVPSAGDTALVNSVVAALNAATGALEGVTVPATWQAGALEVVGLMQQLDPLVARYLGDAAPYIPLAIAVIQSFIATLPAPADAPVTPPAPLARKAMELRRKH